MELTRKILSLLEKNATYTPKDLSELLGEEEACVAEEIARLKESGVILGTKTLINWDKIAPELTVAKIAKEIYSFPEVRSVTLMSGGYDLAVTVVGNSMKDVAMFVGEKLSTLDTVVSTATHFVLKNYKVDGVFYTEEPEDERVITL